MKRLALVVTLIASILLFATFSFATNMGNEVSESVNKTGNTMQNAKNGIGDMARNVVDNVGNATQGAVNTVQNAMNDMGNALNMDDNMEDNNDFNNNNNDNNNDDTNAGNYSAERVATFGNTNDAGNTWIWVGLGIAAVAIIGLSLYYMSDTRSEHHE